MTPSRRRLAALCLGASRRGGRVRPGGADRLRGRAGREGRGVSAVLGGARDHAPGRRELPCRPRAGGSHRRRRGRRRVDRGRAERHRGHGDLRPVLPARAQAPLLDAVRRDHRARGEGLRHRRGPRLGAHPGGVQLRAARRFAQGRARPDAADAGDRPETVGPQALRPRREREGRRPVPARARRPVRAAAGPRAGGVQRGRGGRGNLRRRASLSGDGRLRQPHPPVVPACGIDRRARGAPAAAPPETADPRLETRGSRD